MSEAIEVSNEIDDLEQRKARDFARLKKVATRHAATFLAAMTIWGAADAWATSSGWILAHGVALLNAVFAGSIMAFMAHEWGHFTGARVSGAVSPVMKEPVSFFMFNFKDEANTRNQFLSMSIGGPLGNWLFAFSLFLLLPLETPSQLLLLATSIGIAVSVSVFEFPVMNRVMYGDDPAATIQQRLKETGSMPNTIGIVVGGAFWLLAI